MKAYTTKHGGTCEHPRVQQSGVWKSKVKCTDGSLCKTSRERMKKRDRATVGRISRKVYMSHVESPPKVLPTYLPKDVDTLTFLRSNGRT